MKATKVKIEKCNDKLFVVLPKAVVADLSWGHGDILATELVDGGLKLARSMTAHDHALEIAREVMEEYRETFETLAKS